MRKYTLVALFMLGLGFPIFSFGQKTVKYEFPISYSFSNLAELSIYDSTTVGELQLLQTIPLTSRDLQNDDLLDVICQFGFERKLIFFVKLKDNSKYWYSYNDSIWSREEAKEWRSYKKYFNSLTTPELMALFGARNADRAYNKKVEQATEVPFVINLDKLKIN